jgi:hypothetical protein
MRNLNPAYDKLSIVEIMSKGLMGSGFGVRRSGFKGSRFRVKGFRAQRSGIKIYDSAVS